GAETIGLAGEQDDLSRATDIAENDVECSQSLRIGESEGIVEDDRGTGFPIDERGHGKAADERQLLLRSARKRVEGDRAPVERAGDDFEILGDLHRQSLTEDHSPKLLDRFLERG